MNIHKHTKYKRNKKWRLHKQNSIIKRKLKDRIRGYSYWLKDDNKWCDGLYTYKEWDVKIKRNKYKYDNGYCPWETKYYRPHYKKLKIKDFNYSELYYHFHY